MTAWIVVTLVSKSATSCEIETFITDWSRTIRNCAAARTARTDHLRIRQLTAGEGSIGRAERASVVRYATVTPRMISGLTPSPAWEVSRVANTTADSGNVSPAATEAPIPTA